MKRALLLATFAACGSGSTSSDNGGGGIAFADFSGQFPAALCARLSTCGLVDTKQIDECAKQAGVVLPEGLLVFDWTLIDQTHRRFDGNAGQACLAALAQWDCSIAGFSQSTSAVCKNLFVGTSSAGGVCAAQNDCAAGLVCQRDLGGCGGTCTSTAGAHCTDSSTCGPDLFCSHNVCTTRLAVGAACASNDACAGIGYCLNGKCAVPQPAGGICETGQHGNAECADGTYCTGGKCTARGAAGATCHNSDECAGAQRCAGAAGTITGRCATPKPVGQPCTSGAVETGCADVFHQELCQNERCVAVPGLGDACDDTQATPCRYGERCDSSTKKCVLKLKNGDACTASEACRSTFCQAGKCAVGACGG